MKFLAVTVLMAAAAPLPAQESLTTLIQSGNSKAALEKIRSGANVNEAQPDGTRAVHWAVFRVDYELLEALLAKKAQVNVRNEFGATPIAEAAKLGDARLVKMLLAAGAEPEGANEDGQTALMLAIKTGSLPVVELLANAGANVNAVEKFHQQTPLMWAAAAPEHAPEMVRLLLAKGANVKARSRFIDWDSQISSEPRAQYRPTGGLTPLLYAARNGCLACVEALAAAGADVNLPTPEGVTPLMMAIDNGHNEVAKLLLDRGANPHLWDWWGRTALYVAVERKAAAGGRGGRGGPAPVAARPSVSNPSVSNQELIQAILTAGVDPNPQLNMHRPSRGGNSGRFSESQLSTGATPLFRASQANDEETMRALLAKGASPNINAMGFTPFLIAAGVAPGGRGGAVNMDMLDLMIQKGADVNAQVTGTQTYTMRVSRAPSTNEGATALHAAAQSGRADLVKYLLAQGANPDIPDANGRKAIDLASVRPAAAAPAGGGGGRGGPGGGPSASSIAEVRALLENASKNRGIGK